MDLTLPSNNPFSAQLSSSAAIKSNTLKDAQINSIVTIKGISNLNPEIRNRLLSFGLVKGRQVKITCSSLFGGTRCIELIGYSLALRLSEADCVSVLI